MRIAIVEDDLLMSDQLRDYVLQYFAGREHLCQITQFSDGDEILESYQADYDLIFLDIQMKRLDGLTTAQRIRELDDNVYPIFITNMANYAIKGYSVNALDFVLKPVNYLMLRQLLMRVEQLLVTKTRQFITLPTEKGLTRLEATQIYYVETGNHAVQVYTAKGTWRLRESMHTMETILAEHGFFRCNSCYLINLAHVEQVEGNIAVVAGSRLTISRPRHKAFMTALTKYIGGIKA
jgi:DNA-binding LytR/AlgR family response regulator